jgi:hypothetical protein
MDIDDVDVEDKTLFNEIGSNPFHPRAIPILFIAFVMKRRTKNAQKTPTTSLVW